MTDPKGDPLRSQARRDVIRVLGEKEIANKKEIAKITELSPLTINYILREFRNHKLVTCHAGGLYALSGEGHEAYLLLKTDKRYRKKEYQRRAKAWDRRHPSEEKPVKKTIIIDDKPKKKSKEDKEKRKD